MTAADVDACLAKARPIAYRWTISCSATVSRMELRQLQHFLALAELGSFRLAGERVHLTQQAVSKSIAQLEARVGAQLFERSGRHVQITPVGELLLPYARSITAELRNFADAYDAQSGARSGRLAVGSTPTLLADVVPGVLRKLHRTFPRVLLSVSTGNWDSMLPRLLRGELDIVLSTEPVAPVEDAIVLHRLCPEFNVAACAADHPLAGKRVTPQQLQKAAWIAIERLPRAEVDLSRYFRAARLKPPVPRARTEVTSFAIDWVANSDYLCALPSRAVRGAVSEGRVATLDARLTADPWTLVAAYRRSAVRTPCMTGFLEGMRAALDDAPRRTT